MKIKVLLIFFSVFLLFKANAQNSINGKVIDAQTDEVLPGVNIVLPELTIGTFTNANGNYKIKNLPKGNFLLRFSYIGYETVVKKISLIGKPLTINITMKPLVVQGEEVVVTGSFTETQHENTIKIDALNAKTIAAVSGPSFMNALTTVPGVTMVAKGPGVATPVIRGLSTSNILLLNNGIPLENFQFSEDHPYMIDQSGVGHVEIIKGPASLIYGSGAVGGVINVLPEPVAIKGTITGEAHLKYFGNTIGTYSSLGLKGNNNGFVWGVHSAINSNKDYVQGNGQTVPNSRFNRNSIKANMGMIKQWGIFRVFYEYNRAKLGMAVPPAFPLVLENSRKNKVWYQNLTSNMLTSDNKVFLGKTKLDLLLSYQQNERKLEGSKITPFKTLVDMNLKTLSYRAKAGYDVNNKVSIITGIQGMWQNNENGFAPHHIIPDATITDFSVFGLAKYGIDEILNIETGLRYDYRKVLIPAQGDLNQLSKNYNNVSGSLGATLKFSQNTLLRINLASAYRNPNLAELTEDGLHGIRYEVGNKNLKNQRNMEADIGLHSHTHYFTADITLFYNNINNYIFLSPTTDTTNSGYKIYRYEQTNAILYGSEITFHLHPQSCDWLHFKVSYAYLLGQEQSGEYLPLIPANKLHGEIMIKKNRWKQFRETYAKLSCNYIFAQNNPSEFEKPSNAYSLVNISLGTSIELSNHKTIDVSIAASNLLNVLYVDHLSTLQDVNMYNMGRNITLSVNIPFGIIRK